MKKINLKHIIFSILTLIFITGFYNQPVYGAPIQSRDNSLRDLSISPGELSPDFYSSNIRYNATVPSDTESIDVLATTNHPDAEIVSIEGDDNLSFGENIVSITVEAQDGTPVTYQITVTREEETVQNETDDTLSSPQSDALPVNEGNGGETIITSDINRGSDESNSDESKMENFDLQEKYDTDVRVLFKIILVLALIVIVLAGILIAVVYKNRELTEQLSRLYKYKGENVNNLNSNRLKGNLVFEESDSLEETRNIKADNNKEKISDDDADYYFEEIDE